MQSPADSWAPGAEPILGDQEYILVGARSVVVLVGKQ